MKLRAVAALCLLALVFVGCGEGSSGGASGGTAPISLNTPSLPGAGEGVAYTTTVSATGGKGSYTWSVVGGALPPGLSLMPGTPDATIDGIPTTPGSFDFTLEVSHGGSGVASRQYTIVVQPAQPLSIATTALPTAMVGTSYHQAVTTTGGAQSGHVWTVSAGGLPPGLSVGSSGLDGVVHGTPTIAGSFGFTLRVTDAIGGTATQAFSINVAPTLTVTTTSLPDAFTTAAYSQTITATGGHGPTYTWSILAGSLPTGITLTGTTQTATLGGQTAQTGSFNFTVQVADSQSNTTTRVLALDVLQTPPLSITTTSLADGTQFVNYSELVQATGGLPPYNWSISLGSLPAGLTLTSGTPSATIGGAPSVTGMHSFTVQVQDSASGTASLPLSIQVNTPSFTMINAPTLPQAVDGFYYVEHLRTAGGVVPVSNWQVVAGSMPQGMMLEESPAGATLFGYPAQLGSFTFTVQATDATMAVAQRQFTLQVANTTGPLVIATQYLGDWSTLFNVHTELEAVGGTGSGYTWAVEAGSVLPGGVSLVHAPSPHLAGQPMAQGSYSFTLQVTDSSMATATRTYTVEIIDSGPMRPTCYGEIVREKTVFLLDASSSMFGSRVAVMRAEMNSSISGLLPHHRIDLAAFGDQFGIVNYYSHCMWASTDLPMTAANRSVAINWVNGPATNPGGGTPTYAALKNACQLYPANLKGMFLITDGYPNTSGSASLILADFPSWWSKFPDCHLTGVCIGGGGASFVQALVSLAGGTYVAA